MMKRPCFSKIITKCEHVDSSSLATIDNPALQRTIVRGEKRSYYAAVFIMFLALSLTLSSYDGHHISVKKVKSYAHFSEIPINSIQPEGWLRTFLENQRNGLTGHLEVAGFPFNEVFWGAKDTTTVINYRSWWPYEQNGYWIDGMIRCGELLRDSFLIKKAQAMINNVISHPDPSGFLGPEFLKRDPRKNRWPQAVFFRSLQADYSATHNQSITQALERHYLNDSASYLGERDVVNIETMLWVYQQTGDTAMRNLALKIYKNYQEKYKDKDTGNKQFMDDKPSHAHGVTYNEIAKLGAIVYDYTGDEKYLEPAIDAYKKIDKYHLLIDGVNISDEHMHPRSGSLQSHETCDISDYTWSVGYLLMATGNAGYADKIERAIFNAAPSVVTADFKALQYFSGPNLVIDGAHSSYASLDFGGQGMTYRPNPFTACCPGNVNRMMPNFAARLWMDDGHKGIVAAMYAPSRVTRNLGKKQDKVTIDEITGYPFSNHIQFVFSTNKKVRFPFTFRIPEWCNHPYITFNGKPIAKNAQPGQYVTVNEDFKNNDTLTVDLPAELKLTSWDKNSESVERGPLVFALNIKGNWTVDTADKKSTKEFPAYNLFPESKWNYALCLNNSNLQKVKIVTKPMTNNPWSAGSAPIELIVPVKKVNGWRIDHRTSIRKEKWSRKMVNGKMTWAFDSYYEVPGDYFITPELPTVEKLPAMLSDTIENISLVPYGCTKLRISMFPRANE